ADLQLIPDAGHSALEPGTRSALVEATDKFKSLGSCVWSLGVNKARLFDSRLQTSDSGLFRLTCHSSLVTVI
ncbi:MAG: hypothetical protein QOF61_3157, partial [Acidobacteriota bacterium]|nr:hypothetical protein [Acidobacteriota bacterium]